ncbi:gamma-taxilin-like isoform X1 [Macrobrachium nipponense]|uniref:gamma-taxilin-like isoform X1 n=2 Tax=Macrobrachium nipponense TaxID=159736 RepID=UPI0030C8A0DC
MAEDIIEYKRRCSSSCVSLSKLLRCVVVATDVVKVLNFVFYSTLIIVNHYRNFIDTEKLHPRAWDFILKYCKLSMPGEEPVTVEDSGVKPELEHVEDSGVKPELEHVEDSGVKPELEQLAVEEPETQTESAEVVNEDPLIESLGATSVEVEDPEVQSALSQVSDPTLVDIDKLIEGEVVVHSEDTENMADTKHAKKNKKKTKEAAMDSLQTAMKALSPEEQIATVMSKYCELVENNRQLQSTVKQIQKQVENVQREKEYMETEHSKVVLTKSRLESLCRELQKQNKLIKDENVSRLKEEEERRKEVALKFNTTLSEISNLMKENSEKNTKLRDENQDMAGRLQDLVKQYESRENHVEKVLKAKDLQCQLVEAKMAKQHIEITENKEKMLLEKKALLEDISSYQEKLQTMAETEISLRTQLNSYMEKYEEFQTTLDKSSKIFNTFKKEMDEMTKKIKKLEKETKTWKERWEGANKALLDMVAERSVLEKKMEVQGRQNAQLQNLCRALQEQVTELRKQNKLAAVEPEVKSDILNEVMCTKEASTETVNEVCSITETFSENPKAETSELPKVETSPSVETQDTAGINQVSDVKNITSSNCVEVNGDNLSINTSDTEEAVEKVTDYLDID